MATCLARLERWDEALYQFSQANNSLQAIIKQDEWNASARRYLANNLQEEAALLEDLDQCPEALELFDQAMAYENVSPPEAMRGIRARLQVRLGRYAEAEKDFGAFRQYMPDSPTDQAGAAMVVFQLLQAIMSATPPVDNHTRHREAVLTAAVDDAIRRLSILQQDAPPQADVWSRFFGSDFSAVAQIPSIAQWRAENLGMPQEKVPQTAIAD